MSNQRAKGPFRELGPGGSHQGPIRRERQTNAVSAVAGEIAAARCRRREMPGR